MNLDNSANSFTIHIRHFTREFDLGLNLFVVNNIKKRILSYKEMVEIKSFLNLRYSEMSFIRISYFIDYF